MKKAAFRHSCIGQMDSSLSLSVTVMWKRALADFEALPRVPARWGLFDSCKLSVFPFMPFSVGSQVGPYEILALLGAGGMGEVWKARDTRLNRIVAIKQINGAHTARFEQEARAIAALNHPHVCQIFDVGPDFLVLEYIEGFAVEGADRGRTGACDCAADHRSTRSGA